MKFYVISDNADAAMGLRMAGMEGKVVHDNSEALKALNAAAEDESVGVVLMTTGAFRMCEERARSIKHDAKRPLLVEIPDRNGSSSGETIARYVREAVGIKI